VDHLVGLSGFGAMPTNLREVGTGANNISAWLNIAALLSFSAC